MSKKNATIKKSLWLLKGRKVDKISCHIDSTDAWTTSEVWCILWQ